MKRRIVSTATVAIVVLGFGTGLVGAGSPVTPLPPPGGHLFGVSPANQFPPAGTADILPLIGRFELDLDQIADPLCGGGEMFPIDVAGRIVVHFPDPADPGPPAQIPIEIVSLQLQGVTPLTVNGLGGSDVVIVDVPTLGTGQLQNPTAPEFPAQSTFQVPLQIGFPGTGCDELTTTAGVQLGGRTAGWPPIDSQLLQISSVPLVDGSVAPAGQVVDSMVIPTTPTGAFLKAESIEHEAEQRSMEQALEDAIDGLDGSVAPLSPKIEEMRQFLQTMQEVIDAVSEQTEGADDCKGGADCGPLLEKKVNKLTKKVNKLRKLIKKQG